MDSKMGAGQPTRLPLKNWIHLRGQVSSYRIREIEQLAKDGKLPREEGYRRL